MLDIMFLDTEERIKAFTHPYRMKLLHVYRETKRPMTATEVARVLGDGPGRVHYHMKVLEAAGIVVVARTETVNGIVARYYEPVARLYSVADAARGAVGGEPMREEVSRMISRRFRDGLRAFLERTIGAADAGDASDDARSGNDAFLFEHVLHCSDEDWVVFRDAVEDIAGRFASAVPGTRPRRIFVAGATDKPGFSSGGSSRADRPDGDRPGPLAWPPHPQPER
ncbi:MAG: hypothetical protein CVV51_00835 [Spirochaetae bacterium HGW-Spirochaetae-7]|nr:MAG: hypothetical protein CVV51_00835 [Spirochaetae bacterium HGW-Spirochaetae-7]